MGIFFIFYVKYIILYLLLLLLLLLLLIIKRIKRKKKSEPIALAHFSIRISIKIFYVTVLAFDYLTFDSNDIIIIIFIFQVV